MMVRCALSGTAHVPWTSKANATAAVRRPVGKASDADGKPGRRRNACCVHVLTNDVGRPCLKGYRGPVREVERISLLNCPADGTRVLFGLPALPARRVHQ